MSPELDGMVSDLNADMFPFPTKWPLNPYLAPILHHPVLNFLRREMMEKKGRAILVSQ